MSNMSRKKNKILAIVVSLVIVVGGTITAVVMYPKYQHSQKVKSADSLVTKGKYEKAITAYEELKPLNDKSKIQGKIKKAKVLQESANAFSTAMEFFNSQNYEGAYMNFKDVVKEDTKNYKIALDKIKECKRLVAEYVIQQAKIAESKQDYDSASTYIGRGRSIDSENQQLDDLYKKYYDEKIKADKAKAIQ